ncbi:MAG: hypothetical protein ACRDT6_16805 [Micromonosporaceae bacterium]
MTAQAGTVYLLHLDRPYRHARHYTGWTSDLAGRLAEHAAGHGSRLLAVVRGAGIGWQLARTWRGPRARGTSTQTAGRRRAALPSLRRTAA